MNLKESKEGLWEDLEGEHGRDKYIRIPPKINGKFYKQAFTGFLQPTLYYCTCSMLLAGNLLL